MKHDIEVYKNVSKIIFN